MRQLRTLHAYVGLVLGLLLLMYGVTGAALLFKEDIWRLQYPALRSDSLDANPLGLAESLQRIDVELAGEYSVVMLPRDGLAAYHVYTRNGEALFAGNDGTLVTEWRWFESFTGILAGLHYHLAAGQTGKKIGGFIAIFAVLMAISGLILWWPTRSSFRLRGLTIVPFNRAALIRLHRDLGTLTAASLVLFSVTAIGVIFPTTTRWALDALDGEDNQPFVESDYELPDESYPSTPSAAQIEAATKIFSDARLVAWYRPTDSRPVHFFRFKLANEAHPNGRSAVHVDLNSTEIRKTADATLAPSGERAWHWFYPLHAGKAGGAGYTAFTFLSAIAVSVLGASGFIAFLKRRRRLRRT